MEGINSFRQAGNRFLGSFEGLQTRALDVGPGEVGRGGKAEERHVVEESIRVEAGVQQAAAHRDVLRMRTRDENKEYITGRTANNVH